MKIKDISVIPEGIYCYELIDVTATPKKCIMHVKVCPYWSKWKGGYCKYLKSDYCTLSNKVKECGINMGEDNGIE
jgi:hypothetical protein